MRRQSLFPTPGGMSVSRTMFQEEIQIESIWLALWIFLAVIVITLVCFCCLTTRRTSSTAARGINERDLELCPVSLYRAELHQLAVSDDDKRDRCTICQMEIEDGEKMRLLPCSHHFHRTCVDTWLSRYKASCPLCIRSYEH